jgi:hypothetical protein
VTVDIIKLTSFPEDDPGLCGHSTSVPSLFSLISFKFSLLELRGRLMVRTQQSSASHPYLQEIQFKTPPSDTGKDRENQPLYVLYYFSYTCISIIKLNL